MRELQTTAWSTDNYAKAERFSAWEHQLNSAYVKFALEKPDADDFHASVAQRSMDGIRVINCKCAPFKAGRNSIQMRHDDTEIIGIQFVVQGKERLNIGGEEVVLSPGDILIWDNTRPIAFSVDEELHKISIIMPLSRFRNWLPTSWYTVDKKIAANSHSSGLLSLFMMSLPDHVIARNSSNGDALAEATMGLLVNALGEERQCDSETLRGTQLMRVRQYIHENLPQPDLSPSQIATGNKISVRYLHWLFEPEGLTVSQYIIQQRLIRCRRELANPLMFKRTITDIAFSWGFHNATHFSRRFKQEFGLSPYEFRHAEQSMTKFHKNDDLVYCAANRTALA